jgi:hypothetical protein
MDVFQKMDFTSYKLINLKYLYKLLFMLKYPIFVLGGRIVRKTFTTFALGISILLASQIDTEAKVYWDGAELKPGQIGRLTVLQETDLFKLQGNKKIFYKKLKPGQTFRVYNWEPSMLGIGGGYYIHRDSRIKYETPSKAKLAQVKNETRVVTRGLKPNPTKTYVYYDLEEHSKSTMVYTGKDEYGNDLWKYTAEDGETYYYLYSESKKGMAIGVPNSEFFFGIPYPLTLNRQWEYQVFEGDPIEKYQVTSMIKTIKTHAGTFTDVIEIKNFYYKTYDYYVEGIGLILRTDYKGNRLYELYELR